MQACKQALATFWAKLRPLVARIKTFAVNHKVWATIIAIFLIVALIFLLIPKKNKQNNFPVLTETAVTRRNLSDAVTGSSVLMPNAEYTIVSMVTGEILDAPFEEGDVVTEGQLMYRFDSTDAEKDFENTQLNVQKTQLSYQDTMDTIRHLQVVSNISGTVREMKVQVGDSVNKGSQIATVYDDSYMEIRMPFNAADAETIHKGDHAVLTLIGNGAVLSGTVTAISSAAQSLGGYMSVRYVTMKVANPGALTSSDTATAMIGDVACNDIGTFEPVMDYEITAKTAGTIDKLYIDECDHVSSGDLVAVLDSSSAQTQRLNAEISMRSAELSLEKAQESLDEYTITAPISGTVVTKHKKAGDKIENGSMSSDSKTLALIYDMSSLYCELAIDELDIKKIAVGQQAIITADAASRPYIGIVENVSVSGSIGSNGVTTYPVKIRLSEFDDALLPGMNVEASITIASVENALCVPVSAVNRGNIVYVKGEKTEENDRAPEGFHSVTVTTGITTDQFVEILSGLNEGDIVYTRAQSGQQNARFPGMGSGMPMGGSMPMGGMSGMSGGNRMPGGGMR